MILEMAKEKDLPNGGHFVESKSCFIYWFTNGHQLFAHGQLRAQFDQSGKIDLLDLVTNEHSEYVPRTNLLQTAAASPDIKQSPSQSKAAGKRGSQQRQKQQVQAAQDQTPQVTIPDSMVNDSGTTQAVLHFLEIAETMSSMQTLFQFAQTKPNLSVNESLNQLSLQFQNAPQFQHQPAFNPSLHQQQQQQQQHALNPALQLAPGANSHFVSPAQAAHLNLPVNTTSASPATLNMSPAMQNNALQNQMGGNTQQLLQQPPTSVGMVAQQSQQGTTTSGGTGSQGTSANASPNQTNKRRRASAVKAEGDDGGGGGVDVNGTGAGPKTVKPSPRGVGGGKRQKGNA